MPVGISPPEGPPTWIALSCRSPSIPPPMPKTMSRNDMPMGISTRPLFRTLPERVKTFVPLLSSVPIRENQSPPIPTIIGMFEKVSALLMTVGLPQSPA